jgi:hypothetical protein
MLLALMQVTCFVRLQPRSNRFIEDFGCKNLMLAYHPSYLSFTTLLSAIFAVQRA